MILTSSISLARAEILLAVATIFREFEMELYDTTVDDVKIVRDMFNGLPRKGSQGVRVMIKDWNGHPEASRASCE
jgi:hypothetical protein